MKKLLSNGTLLLFTLIAVLLLSDLLKHYGAAITNEISPRGIISFELATSKEAGLKIMDSWGPPGIAAAKRQTSFDFLFIVAYTLLACMLVHYATSRMEKRPERWLKTGITLALVAGVMDVTENIFILQALYNPDGYVPAGVFIPAYIKFGLLLITGIFVAYRSLRILSHGLFVILQNTWIFRIVFIGLIFTFLILWGMDQGQDLLLSINSHPIGPAISLVMISLFAVANWYFPKYYDTVNRRTFTLRNVFFGKWDYEVPQYTGKTYTGRLLGAFSLMLPGACILNAMQVFRITYWLDFLNPFTIIVIMMILYYMILKNDWFCSRMLVTVIAIIAIGIVFSFGFMPENNQPYFLAFFAFDFFLLSFTFLLYTNIRKGVNQQVITPYIMFTLLAVTLFFFLANLSPTSFAFTSERRFLTLPIVFSGIIFYVFFFSMLLIAGKRYKIQFITFLLAGALLIGMASDNEYHRIRFLETAEEQPPAPQPEYDSLHRYARQWLATRRTEIAEYNRHYGRPYPVFIINAYGGGIRAAAWTSKVVHAIDTALITAMGRNGQGPAALKYDFEHYVFAYSGASGGTIGASVLCAQRYHELKSQEFAPADYNSFYKNDFLTPVLIPLLGRDIWFSFLGGKVIDDRGRIQERTWEHHAARQLHFDYGRPLRDYWYDKDQLVKYEIPLLFANTYDIDQGLKAIAAPVLLSATDFPVAFRINDDLALSYSNARRMRLSTAAFLSARFPYISPEAKYDGNHHFLDGGLKENSGAETAGEIRRCLEAATQLPGGGRDSSIQFYMLSLPNAIKETDTIKKAKNVFELTAPLTALMNNWVGNTYKADSVNAMLQHKYGYIYQVIRPVEPPKNSTMIPVLPLGWQISNLALDYIDASIRHPENKRKIDALVNRICYRKDTMQLAQHQRIYTRTKALPGAD
jgi:hypothetical protein